MDGAARSQSARCRRAGGLPRHSLRVRASSTRTRRPRRTTSTPITVLRHRDREHRASIAAIHDGTMLDKLLRARRQAITYGWFWQLQELPDAPESRYLYHLLAGHDFQEGLKNYRDLAFLGGTLARWQRQHGRLRRHARHARARVCRARAAGRRGARLGAPRRIRRDRATRSAASSTQIEAAQDVAALGTAEERDQWARIVRLEAALLDRAERRRNAT